VAEKVIKSMTSVCLEPFLFLIATTGINVISGFKSTKAKEGVTKGAKIGQTLRM